MASINIAGIRVLPRLRGAGRAAVERLADNIAAIGLQHPITVCRTEEYVNGQAVPFIDLVAGLHRLEACKRLGLVEIEANVVEMTEEQRQLWEIDENLCRADLSELEKGEHMKRRKEVYLNFHPETKAGVAGALAANQTMGKGDATANLSVASFAADTADKIGVTDREIRRSIRRAEKIDAKIRDRIRDNPEIADSGVELDALCDMAPEDQRKAVALVETQQAVSIRDAKKLMAPKPVKTTPNFKGEAERSHKWRIAFTKLVNTALPADLEWAREELDEPVADNTTALRAVQ